MLRRTVPLLPKKKPMAKPTVEAVLDQYALKQIADELRLYAAEETVPDTFLELVRILDGTETRAGDDAKGKTRRPW